MTEYVLKDIQHYKNIKKLYNFEPLTIVWHDEGAPSSKIGKCVDSFKAWFSTTTDFSMNSFCQYYFENVKSIKELSDVALNLISCFMNYTNSFKGREKEILDAHNVFDLVIFHAIVETYNGVFAEEEINKYLNDSGRQTLKVEELDRLYGIDILIKNKDGVTMSGVQIKPVSFFRGSQYDLIKDRKKVFTQFERLLKGKNEYNVNKLFFAIYKTDNNGKMEFFNEKDTYFHHFRDYDDMVNRDWKKICDNSKIWTKIKHEISRQ